MHVTMSGVHISRLTMMQIDASVSLLLIIGAHTHTPDFVGVTFGKTSLPFCTGIEAMSHKLGRSARSERYRRSHIAMEIYGTAKPGRNAGLLWIVQCYVRLPEPTNPQRPSNMNKHEQADQATTSTFMRIIVHLFLSLMPPRLVDGCSMYSVSKP